MSTDGGSVWTKVDDLYFSDGADMLVDPENSGTVWTGGQYSSSGTLHIAVSKTTDWGQNWIRYDIGSAVGHLFTLAMDPDDSDIIYAGGYESSISALYRTVNGGSSWSKLAASGLSGYVYDIVVTPDPADILLAATGNGIYRSTDGGSSFSRIAGSVNRTNALLLDPDENGTVYAATQSQGVWVSLDSGDSWNVMNDGLDELTVNVLAIDQSEWLFAGTGGSAVWGWDLDPQGVGSSEAGPGDCIRPHAVPNPVSSYTTINYVVEEEGPVHLSVYDLAGRLVRVIVDGPGTVGCHTAVWNPGTGEAAPGIYFIRLMTGYGTDTGRMILIR